MTYQVLLRDNETGVTRTVDMNEEWAGDFLWTEGNFACDCNRGQLFAESAGESDPNVKCGDNRYFASFAVLPNGDYVKLDEEEPA